MASKLERLLNLVAALLDTERPLAAEEIRVRIDGYADSQASFRRAFERDKDDLRAMGIPIVIEAIPGTNPPADGYRIHRRDYASRSSALEPDELAALHLAASLVEIEGLDDEAFWKLGGVADEPEIDGPRFSLPTDPNLADLFSAARERTWVGFRYRSEPRHVLPRRLTFTNGHWYLSAWDAVRRDHRSFRVDRIDGDVSAAAAGPDPTADPPRELRLKPWELGDEDDTPVRVLIDADQAAWARHEVGPTASVSERHDGSIEVELAVRNRAGLCSFVLSYLDHAEVLGPPDVRSEVVAWVEGLLARRRAGDTQ